MNPVVVTLAAHRLTQLVVEDELTRPLRQAIDAWAGDAPEFSFRDRVATLINCNACMSVWSGAAILLATRIRRAHPLVRILAMSGAALAMRALIDRLER